MTDTSNSCCQTEAQSKCCGFTCPISGITFNGRFIGAALAMIVWANLFSWFWHNNILKDRYMATANLWRPEAEMIPWALTLGISLTAFFATHIFIKGFEGKGLIENVRFGIIMTLLFGGALFIAHATQPIPSDILQMWALGDFIMYTVGSFLIGCIVKKGCCK